jgi:hypothetical protein
MIDSNESPLERLPSAVSRWDTFFDISVGFDEYRSGTDIAQLELEIDVCLDAATAHKPRSSLNLQKVVKVPEYSRSL